MIHLTRQAHIVVFSENILLAICACRTPDQLLFIEAPRCHTVYVMTPT